MGKHKIECKRNVNKQTSLKDDKEKVDMYILKIMVIFIWGILVIVLVTSLLDYNNLEIPYLIKAVIILISLFLSIIFMIEQSSEISRLKESEYRKYLLSKLQPQNIEKVKAEKDVFQNIVNQDALRSSVKKNDDAIKLMIENEDEIENIIRIRQKQEKKDIIALMIKNNDEITEYFTISKNQAKSSFWFSVISCVFGIIAFSVGIYGIVVLQNVSISIISLISGSMSELISGTVFWVHNKSALQLNHYYDALHENEKFLAAINMADKLSEDKREEMYIEIIRKQIEVHSSEKHKD